MKYSTISQSLIDEMKSSTTLTEEFVRTKFIDCDFPCYDIGSKVISYLKKHGVNDKTEIIEFGKEYLGNGKALSEITFNRREITRNQAIQIAFGLGLSLEETNSFLLDLRFVALHYRSVEDLVYAYYLKNPTEIPSVQSKTPYENIKHIIDQTKRKIKKQKKQTTQTLDTIYRYKEADEILANNYTTVLKNSIEQSVSLEILLNDAANTLSKVNGKAISYYRKYYGEITDTISNLTNFHNALMSFTTLDLNTWDNEIFQKRIFSYDIYSFMNEGSIDINKNSPNNEEVSTYDQDTLLPLPRTDSAKSRIVTYDPDGNLSRETLIILLLFYINLCLCPKMEPEYDVLPENLRMENSYSEYVFDRGCEFINKILEDCLWPTLQPRAPFDFLVLTSLASVNYEHNDPYDIFLKTWKQTVRRYYGKIIGKSRITGITIKKTEERCTPNATYSEMTFIKGTREYTALTNISPEKWDPYLNIENIIINYEVLEGMWNIIEIETPHNTRTSK